MNQILRIILVSTTLVGCGAIQTSQVTEDSRSDVSIESLERQGRLAHQSIAGGFGLGDCARTADGQPRLAIIDQRLRVLADDALPEERAQSVTIACHWNEADTSELSDAGWLQQYSEIINSGREVYGIVAYAAIAPGTHFAYYGDENSAPALSLRSIQYNLAVRGSYAWEFTREGHKPRNIPVTLTVTFPEALRVVTLTDLHAVVERRFSFPSEF